MRSIYMFTIILLFLISHKPLLIAGKTQSFNGAYAYNQHFLACIFLEIFKVTIQAFGEIFLYKINIKVEY